MMHLPPKVIAHRGASMFAPENSLPAFTLAQILGAQMFECDVQLSKDFVPVIFHDDTLERVTNGSGCVFDFTLAELKALRLKNTFAAQPFNTVTSIQIPTLLETLAWCLSTKMRLNLELKINSLAKDSPLVQHAVEVIKGLPAELSELMLVSSFDWDALQQFHDLLPQFSLALLVDKPRMHMINASELRAVAKNMKVLSVNFEYELLLKHPDFANSLKEVVPAVLAYTVNDSQTAKVLFDLGVDGVFSDNPKLLG